MKRLLNLTLCFGLGLLLLAPAFAEAERPNILWIVVEDASAHVGCYGETTIQTPTIDQLAQQGIRFTQAFVTCPVCSPCRSALVTGVSQTTLGAHNHRSQSDRGKAKGGPDYQDSYRLPVPTIPRLFKDAGYFTCNSSSGLPNARPGKTDYNFIWNAEDYDDSDWAGREEGQPFFAQVQLHGGKNRKAHQHNTDPASVTLPPYYADHPDIRKDWAEYLNSWVQTDREVAAILQRLEDEHIADSTAVFFLTDHGISHLRGKQYLYEEGIRVPLIVRLPQNSAAGQVRHDLVNQLDLAASSLALAGIPRPAHLQGLDLFADDYEPRDRVYAARDRCDETVDVIRCVRTERWKYIRNFMPHLPHAQPNRYKDGKQIIQTMRQLYADGELNRLQARLFVSPRPAEELYDLQNDPDELSNLAQNPDHAAVLSELRSSLNTWMRSSGDLGMIPEPVLEELGRESGNKYDLLQTDDQQQLVTRILTVLQAQDQRVTAALVEGLTHTSPAVRYHAATGLGLCGDSSHRPLLKALLKDDYEGVRVAAALARGRLDSTTPDSALLGELITSDNYLVGMFAIRALELLGPDVAARHAATIQAARKSPYEFTRRIAVRLSDTLAAHTD